MEYEILYAQSPEEIARVVGALVRARDRRDAVGFDTEFYGVDIGSQSCYGLARLHLISVAVKRFPHVLSPRGYMVADAAVLPATALPSLRSWLEDPEAIKVIHNAPVDIHTIANGGVTLRGGINSLSLARWAWPERARGEGFTLDSLGRDFLGVGKTEDFRELFQEDYVEMRSTWRKESRCECGASPCRRRQTTPGHCRVEEMVETVHERPAKRPVPLQSVGPGHILWERTLRYAAQDAVLALAVYDLAQNALKVEREVPWLDSLQPPSMPPPALTA
jgi:hypothetical protein